MPVLNQQGNGMCYAYAAAQLANYQLIKSGSASSPEVDPAWTALLYAEVSNERDFRGGITATALNALAARNNCDGDILRSAISARARIAGVTEAKFLKFIDDYAKSLRGQSGSANERRLRAINEAGAMNPQCPLANWRRVGGLPEFFQNDSASILGHLLASACSERNLKKLNLPRLQTMRQGDDSEFEEEIHAALTRGNPVAATFCSWATDRPHTTPPRYVTTGPRRYRQSLVDEKTCGTHIALFVGQKTIRGECNFLYRNSRGTSWYKDIRHLTCLCRDQRTDQTVDDCRYSTHNTPRYQVEACWVPRSTLVPNIFDLNHY